MSPTHERRCTRRRKMTLTVTCHVDGKACYPSTTSDLSPTGALIDGGPLCEPGTDLMLAFDAASFGEAMMVPATVRRLESRGSRPPSVGVSFDLLLWDAAERARFFRRVSDLILKGPPPAKRAAPAPSSSRTLYRSTQCGGCGWEGFASKFARACPRCGSGAIAASP